MLHMEYTDHMHNSTQPALQLHKMVPRCFERLMIMFVAAREWYPARRPARLCTSAAAASSRARGCLQVGLGLRQCIARGRLSLLPLCPTLCCPQFLHPHGLIMHEACWHVVHRRSNLKFIFTSDTVKLGTGRYSNSVYKKKS